MQSLHLQKKFIICNSFPFDKNWLRCENALFAKHKPSIIDLHKKRTIYFSTIYFDYSIAIKNDGSYISDRSIAFYQEPITLMAPVFIDL